MFLKSNTALFHVLTSRMSLCPELQVNSALALGLYKGLGLRVTMCNSIRTNFIALGRVPPSWKVCFRVFSGTYYTPYADTASQYHGLSKAEIDILGLLHGKDVS